MDIVLVLVWNDDCGMRAGRDDGRKKKLIEKKKNPRK